MAKTDLRLAIVIWAGLYGVLMAPVVQKMVDAQRAFFNAKSALVVNLVDSFSNFDTLKLFSSKGEIFVDGQNIRTLDQDRLRRDGATQAEIITAAQKAHADEFIENLCDSKGRTGFEAHVGERGVKLSGGQRQRIALARAMLKNAPILILDEATSALDSEVKAKIQRALKEVMEGKTVISITHRISTIAKMDRILVMNNGRIVEGGSHHELLAQNGQYSGFWNRQSGGMLGAD